MSDSEFESRRKFLQNLALLAGCQYFGGDVFAAPVKNAAKAPATKPSGGAAAKAGAIKTPAKYKLAPWTQGDDFTMGHKLRAGEWPKFPEKAERSVDFVIVGGGVAGMTAAYNLRDQNFLLLEQYGELGGHARGGSYHGIDYSCGAAYIGVIDDIYGELYSAIGIEPVKLEPERNDFYFSNKWFNGTKGDVSKQVYKEFNQLIESSKPIWNGLPEDPDPVKIAASADLTKLDNGTFAGSLKGYSKEFLALMESFCKSSFGGGLDQLSALAGYALIQDLVIPTWVFKGGNSAIGKGLSKKVTEAGADRCLKNTFVWKIDINDKGASVTYESKDGSLHKVDCRHVIIATPPLVAARQLSHIPDLEKALLLQFKFCSYLVANMLMKEKLFKGSYDCFVPEPYSFADITVAETPYMKTNSYKPEMGSVLTIYQPYPYGTMGRPMLLMGNREEFAESLTKQMEQLIPGFFKSIDEVVLTRWGHALAIVGPQYFGRLAKLQAAQKSDSYTLAHSSMAGWPAVESAIRAGTNAAAKARKLAANPGFVVQ